MQALKRVEAGLAVPDLCREIGISTATFYKWRAKIGGMDTSLMSRMKELEGRTGDSRRYTSKNNSKLKSPPSTSQKTASSLHLPSSQALMENLR